jgi:hypothetical protein
MPSKRKKKKLVDTETGSEFSREEIGGATVTIERTVHPYRQLMMGASFVTLTEDVIAIVNDAGWAPILGTLVLFGGTELDVDAAELERALADIEECDEDWEDAARRRPDLFDVLPAGREDGQRYGLRVPLRVNDIDIPSVRILVGIATLRTSCQRIGFGEGAHAFATNGTVSGFSTCRHTASEMTRTNCRSCFRRWWSIEGKKAGLY